MEGFWNTLKFFVELLLNPQVSIYEYISSVYPNFQNSIVWTIAIFILLNGIFSIVIVFLTSDFLKDSISHIISSGGTWVLLLICFGCLFCTYQSYFWNPSYPDFIFGISQNYLRGIGQIGVLISVLTFTAGAFPVGRWIFSHSRESVIALFIALLLTYFVSLFQVTPVLAILLVLFTAIESVKAFIKIAEREALDLWLIFYFSFLILFCIVIGGISDLKSIPFGDEIVNVFKYFYVIVCVLGIFSNLIERFISKE